MLLKEAENFQYNSFHSNLSELDVYVINIVFILLGLLGTATNDFQVHGSNSCLLQKQHWVALWEHCWQEREASGQGKGWEVWWFASQEENSPLQWSVNYLEFPLKLFKIHFKISLTPIKQKFFISLRAL